MTMTAKEAIVQVLAQSDRALAVHEIEIEGVSENSIAARLRELRRTNVVVRRKREGKDFLEWTLTVKARSFGFSQEPGKAPSVPVAAPSGPVQGSIQPAANNPTASNSARGYQPGQLF